MPKSQTGSTVIGNFVRGTKRRWMVGFSLQWHIGKKGSPYVRVIPVGYEFESSVPWWATWFLDQDDPLFLEPAAVHDWFLEYGYSPAFCDSQWYDACRKTGAPLFKRELIYTLMRFRRMWRAFKAELTG